jgi:hypothetical protein
MDKDTSYILGVLLGLFIISYEPPQKVAFFLSRFYYKLVHVVNHYNHLFYNKYLNQAKITDQNQDKEADVVKSKYEDKYLAEIRKLVKEYVFTDDEEIIKLQKFNEFLRTSNDTYTVKIEEIKDKLNFIEIELAKYELEEETGKQEATGKQEETGNQEDEDNEDLDEYVAETREERIKSLNDNNTQLVEELNTLTYFIDTTEGQEELRTQAEEQSKQYIIDQRLEKLKNCFVMESTPLGNVLMIYDKERNSFKYYSDNSIPYRYLEVVARKYVKQFSCRPVFVDMEEELKLAEEKWEQEKKEKEEKAEEEKQRKEEAIKNNIVLIEEKKNVFAKFKQYNKTAGTGHVSKAAPPKNSIPNKSFTEKRENEKILLKDKANRYTYEGKLANFSFLKKVNRKDVNKKFAMTFADFKRLQTKS